MKSNKEFTLKELQSRIFNPFRLITNNNFLEMRLENIENDGSLMLGANFAVSASQVRPILFALDNVLVEARMKQLDAGKDEPLLYSSAKLQELFNASGKHVVKFLKMEGIAHDANMPSDIGYLALLDAIAIMKSSAVREIQKEIRTSFMKEADPGQPIKVDTDNAFQIMETAPYATDADFDVAAQKFTEVLEMLRH
ncbi:MAG: hypothetical protein CMH26_07175 [Micavibrio sp.]|nr:hypothetical protein [Micavibrio sp.]|tara:strand:+ start:2028 stop:2615 length:588 start_codon:yes stop_codon:yes gene_type:complete